MSTVPIPGHTAHATRILDLCQHLRVLDDAVAAARHRLDELADLVVAVPTSDDLPARLRLELRRVNRDLDRLEVDRRVVRRHLDAVVDVCETVPVRVLHPGDLHTEGNTA